MNKEINELKKIFLNIKKKNYHKSLRGGTTGIGYTFETLINKKEDCLSLPDFKGIEIKTKLGYSKSPLTLFSLTPKKENDRAVEYLVKNFGYKKKDSCYPVFKTDVYLNKKTIFSNKYILKLKLEDNKLVLYILDLYLDLIDNSIYWDLNDLYERLFLKLNYMALVKGYPYKIENELYFKYTSLHIYKIRNFNDFIELLKEQKIFITFNIDYYRSGARIGKVYDRGTSFRLNIECITDLFELVE